MEDWQDRTRLLAGEAALQTWREAHVLVMGLGGVGAYAAEQLVRAGVGHITLADGDRLHPTNLNRQLPALRSTLGAYKTETLRQRFLDINPDLDCQLVSEYLKDERMIEVLQAHPYHYVVDAIDTLSPKIYLLYHCVRLGLKVVSTMGTGGKWNPEQLTVCDIAQTYQCRLADVLRKRLHKLGVYGGIQAVFSPEVVAETAVREEEDLNKKSAVGTVSYMPAVAGCFCASVVLRELAGYKVESHLPVPHSVRKRLAATSSSARETAACGTATDPNRAVSSSVARE